MVKVKGNVDKFCQHVLSQLVEVADDLCSGTVANAEMEEKIHNVIEFINKNKEVL